MIEINKDLVWFYLKFRLNLFDRIGRSQIEVKTIQTYLSQFPNFQIPELLKVKELALSNQIPLVDDEVGYLLYLFSSLKKPKNILEIGFGSGYSTLWMAYGSPGSKILTLDKNPDRYSLGLKTLEKFSFDITLKNDDARQFLNTDLPCFDMVFIDGVKSQYMQYVMLLENNNKMTPGAVVIADNIYYRGKYNEENLSPRKKKELKKLENFSEFISHHPKFHTFFLTAGDGLSVSLYQGGY